MPRYYWRAENIDFIEYYAKEAANLIQDSARCGALRATFDYRRYNPIFEQYILSAYAAHKGIAIAYLFSSFWDACNRAGDVGFTHLMGSAKSNLEITQHLEARVARDYPDHYARCIAIA